MHNIEFCSKLIYIFFLNGIEDRYFYIKSI